VDWADLEKKEETEKPETTAFRQKGERKKDWPMKNTRYRPKGKSKKKDTGTRQKTYVYAKTPAFRGKAGPANKPKAGSGWGSRASP